MNILVISPSWVGDMMMSHSLYQTLKHRYPYAQIDVLAPNWCAPLLARMPEVRQAINMPIGHGSLQLMARYHIGKTLRNQYDMAIILPNSFKSALIPMFANIPLRRGWKGESRYFLLNDLRQNKHAYPMMVQRYVALAFEKDKCSKAETLSIPTPYLRVSQEEIIATMRTFADLLQQEQMRKVIGFCPGAEFGPAKRWPHYHYARLASMLIDQGFAIRLFGSSKDHSVGERIRQALSNEQQVFCTNLAGRTHLNQVVDLIHTCQGIVTNDSGLMHITAALERPLVALYGPTSPRYTPPLTDKAVVLRVIEGGLIKIRRGESKEGYHQSLIDISPEKVIESLETLGVGC